MAFDAYMQFQDSKGAYIAGESQVVIVGDLNSIEKDLNQANVFEIDSFGIDIEQVLNIGSQSSGIGAGKVNFTPYKISRKSDKASPIFFKMCCAGTHFSKVSLYLRRAGGADIGTGAIDSGHTFLRFDFALIGIKTISWNGADGDESPKEDIEFEYGAVQIQYLVQAMSGTMAGGAIQGSWNRVANNSNFPATITTK